MCPYTDNLNFGIYNIKNLYYWGLSANVYQILPNWGNIVLNPRYNLLLPWKQSAVPNQWSECSGSHFSVAIRVRLPHMLCGIVSKEKKPVSPPKTPNATAGPSFSVTDYRHCVETQDRHLEGSKTASTPPYILLADQYYLQITVPISATYYPIMSYYFHLLRVYIEALELHSQSSRSCNSSISEFTNYNCIKKSN